MGLYTIGLLSISEIFGDFALKKFANDGGIKHLGYVGVIFFLIMLLKGSNVMMVNAAWDGID